MWRLAPALAAALALPTVAAASSGPPGLHRRSPIVRPELGRRRFLFRPFLRPPPDLLPSPPPGEFLQPPPPEPGPSLEGSLGPRPPLGHGFQLSVAVGTVAAFRVPATLNRYVDVGQALGACFAPPAGLTWASLTLRVSFKRDGSVFGDPRIPYNDAETPEQKTELARSLLAALKHCSPLPLSPSLGRAIAGEIFAVRFIHQENP